MLRVFVALAFGLTAVLAASAQEEGLSTKQQDEVQALIREHLIGNPEILREAFTELQRREEEARQTAVKNELGDLDDTLRSGAGDPIGGNPDGEITVVEFFDYNCPYCRKVKPEVHKLLEGDDRIRYVFKEFPILSESSVAAARVALAVWDLAPEAYWDLHTSLMGAQTQLDDRIIRAAVEEVGLDWNEVQARAGGDDIAEKIRETLELAARLQISGTPSFVIGEQIIPGYVRYEQLRAAVASAAD